MNDKTTTDRLFDQIDAMLINLEACLAQVRSAVQLIRDGVEREGDLPPTQPFIAAVQPYSPTRDQVEEARWWRMNFGTPPVYPTPHAPPAFLPPRYRSGRWPLRDGDHFATGAGKAKGASDADNPTGDVRPTDQRRD